mmetsp:Transcript_10479/g.23997  ORF Transcript_10479/g.23997 Transcript_10479/m.23997 type:complete len:174 (-) Transcript_10479:14-535(-)
MINLRRTIRDQDQSKIADKLLLRESRGNPDETLTEAEFLIGVLKDHKLVDDLTLASIRAEFRELVSSSEGAFETRVLDDRLVFKQLKEDGRIAQRHQKPLGSTKGTYQFVNLNMPDGGYGEWRRHHWEKQVKAYAPPEAPVNTPTSPPFQAFFDQLFTCGSSRAEMKASETLI